MRLSKSELQELIEALELVECRLDRLSERLRSDYDQAVEDCRDWLCDVAEQISPNVLIENK